MKPFVKYTLMRSVKCTNSQHMHFNCTMYFYFIYNSVTIIHIFNVMD